MRTRDCYDVDYSRLDYLLKKRGLTAAKAGRELGFSDNYFANVKARGRITKSGAILLERVFGIKAEDYSMNEAEPVNEKPAEFDYDRLYEVIYTAVYQAVKMAWKEC